MSPLDMERICRLCCGIRRRMRSLFEQRPEYPRELRQIIYGITQLEVDPDDGMPQKICTLCVVMLVKMYKAVENYQQNDSILRMQLNRSQPHEVEDIVEVGEYAKHETADEEQRESDFLDPEAINETVEKENADHEEGSPEHNMSRKGKPSNKHNEQSQVSPVDANELDAQGNRPIQKPELRRSPRGRSNIETSNPSPTRPQLYNYKCYICKSEYRGTTVELRVHLNDHKDLLPFTCSEPECTMETVVLTTLQSVNVHLKQHSNPETCPYCDKRFLSKPKVAVHVRQQHSSTTTNDGSSKKYECNICKKRLARLTFLRNHLKTFHSDSSPALKCSYCPKMYITKVSLKDHELKHVQNPNYMGSYQNWTRYYTLAEGGTGSQQKKRKCNLCGRITTRISEHLRTLHFPSRYECALCGNGFIRKQKLRKHLATHQRRKAHQCPFCELRFICKAQLRAHKSAKHRDQQGKRKLVRKINSKR